MKSYILWYPFLAACSFIKKENFSRNSLQPPEYIIPQLFLTRLNEKYSETNLLYGIRYFSCATKASYKKGFNYVFPIGKSTNEIKKSAFKYSDVLIDSFTLKAPKLLKKDNSNKESFNNSMKLEKFKKLENIKKQ